jgi:PEP-CTERM motif
LGLQLQRAIITERTKTFNANHNLHTNSNKMKKLLITAISGVALIGATVSSFGQGTVTWNNSNSTTATSGTPAMFGTGAPLAGTPVTGPSGTYEYGLYVGAAGDTSISQMTLVATYLNSSAAPAKGTVAGGQVTLPNGYPNGTAISDIVAGWTAADGSSYAAAIASGDPLLLSGLSNIGSVTPASPPAVVWGHGAGNITGITLTAAPEPATIALGGLGAAALLLFRRKKQ